MSRISSRNTKPELLVRKFLFAKGLRYRLHDKKLPGKPDLTLRKFRTVIFVNGCFWHGHKNCKYFVIPKTRSEFWSKKIASNVQRDEKVIRQLQDEDWKTLVVWECELKTTKTETTLSKILKKLIKIEQNNAQS